MMLPSSPSGFHWRMLMTQDGPLLRPLWLKLDDAQGGSPVWRSWRGSLIDVHKGDFDPGLLRVAGLFSREGVLVACAAETISLEHGQVSEINFVVLPDWRGKGLGIACLRAGLALARAHGSTRAHIECGAESQDAVATLTRFGLAPVGGGSSGVLWQAYVNLSLLSIYFLALKRVLLRLLPKRYP